TLGIVLADTGGSRVGLEYLLRREFACLGENYQRLPVNFSTGIALSQAPVVRDALAVLAMSPKKASVTVKAVVALLRSRFLDLPDRDGVHAQRFIRRLHEQGSASLTLARLRDIATDSAITGTEGLRLGKVLLAVSGMRALRQKAPPSAWVAHFAGVLDEWGWPGKETLDSLEFQQVKRWYETLDEFRALDAVWPSVECVQALHLLRESCAQQVSQPQTADAPVQVLGPLEAVGLSFDHLWVTGMQGGAWPAAARPNPFVPLFLQARLEMPHATPEREWDYSEQLLRHYERNCSWVHASYSRESDGVVDMPSALVDGFHVMEPSNGSTLSPRWLDAQLHAVREVIDDSQAPTVSTRERDALRGGSALLEHQSQCAFRGFAQHRLQVEPLAEFRPGVLPPERGTLVHEALQTLWTELGDHASLLAAPAEALEDLVERATRRGISTLPPARRFSLGPACIELESDRLRQLLSQWLDVERARGRFSIQALEQQVELALRGLRIRLRVDRMDELPDGSRVVIDYKTGRASVTDWLGQRPRRPQLLLYGLASDAPPAALAFAVLRPRESAYVGLGSVESIPGVRTDIAKAVKDAQPAEDWASLNAAWRVSLEQLAQAFIDGDASVDPLKHSCTWCGLQPLCRVDSVPGNSADDELDHSAEPDAGSGWFE
ncbi:MAG: PD-(D/E)XK nuclease family protein, partial [Halioglobus sp.]|nr:PD-(D/E)XK nuclease family protein [Halioglobus sp.]